MAQQDRPKPERRVHERIPIDARIELFYEDDSLGPYPSVDVSEGGVQIRGFPLPILSRVKLLVHLPEEDNGMMVDGTIAWRAVGRSGIQFVDMSPATEGLIRKAIARRSSKP